MPVWAVDISRWDGTVSIPKLKAAGVGAVIVKCGGGDQGIYTDSKWGSNYANCKAASMPTGAYWYLGATTIERAKDEAAYCVSLLRGKRFEYPIYVDVEERAHQQMSPAALARVICAFTDTLKAAGYLPGVYSWKWLLEPCGSKVADLEWWVCAWTKTKPCDCGMWQFGGETNLLRPTTVAGYPNMDQSYAYVDYPALVKSRGLNGYPKEEKSVALSVPEKIAQVSEHFASHDRHGYSQPNRGTGDIETITLSDGSKVKVTNSDVDCSEMVRQCVNAALSGTCGGPIAYMWTGSQNAELTAHGFERIIYSASKVRRGDVLWVSGHTGVALGDGLQADAHGDEYGGINGPNKGDQTGHEVEVRALRSWTYIYRYKGDEHEQGEWFHVTQKFTFKKRTYVRESPSRKAKAVARYERGDSVKLDGLVLADGYCWGTYVGGSGIRRWVALGTTERGNA